jgi:ABC-type uncharacterized transport system permease subunit
MPKRLTVQKALKVARVMLSVYYAYMVEYRAELVFWVLSGTFPLILMGLWVEAAQGERFRSVPHRVGAVLFGGVSGAPVHRGLGDLGV